ncbi:MAG: FAD-dependent oxidoreductase [Thermomicrobiales bacterium]
MFRYVHCGSHPHGRCARSCNDRGPVARLLGFIVAVLCTVLAMATGSGEAWAALDGSARVLVIGGGPSGLANALILAQQGAQVHVVDQGKAPYKLQAVDRSRDGLLVLHGRTLDYFELMADINLAKMVGATLLKGRSDIYGLKDEGRRWWSHRMEEYLPHQASQEEATADEDIRVTLARIGDPQPRAIVERSALYKRLYDEAVKAGVHFDFEKRVIDVEKTGPGVTVQTVDADSPHGRETKAQKADLVVFSDGASSTLLQAKGIEFFRHQTNGDVIYARSNNTGDRMLQTIEGIAGARLATIHGHIDGLGLFVNRRENLDQDAQTAAERVAQALGISHLFPVSQHKNIVLSHPQRFFVNDRTLVSAGATYGHPVLGLDLNFRILGAVVLGAAYEGILRGDRSTLSYYNDLMKIGSETVVGMGQVEPAVPLKSDKLPTFLSPIPNTAQRLIKRAVDERAMQKVINEIVDSGESTKYGSKERIKYTKERFTADGRSPSMYINSFYNGASDELSAIALKANTTSTSLSSIDGNRDTRVLTWGVGTKEAKYLYKDKLQMLKLRKKAR